MLSVGVCGSVYLNADADGWWAGGRGRGAVGGRARAEARGAVGWTQAPPRPKVCRRRLDLHGQEFQLQIRWCPAAFRPVAGTPAVLACNKTRNASLISLYLCE